MTVKEWKELLAGAPDEQEVVLLKESRMGHDDAVHDYEVVNGFLSEDNDDVRLEKVEPAGRGEDDEDYDEEFEQSYQTACLVINFW